MLNILYGRARTGKTTLIMSEISRRMKEGETGILLIVPEQYSHDAERQLCSYCGDALSVHAEVQTFTRLCRRVFEETGGAGIKVLDRSGQILVMHNALEAISKDLKVFGTRRKQTDIPEPMLSAICEFKNMCITPTALEEMALQIPHPLSDKLRDFALIMSSYDALLKTYGCDNVTRLDMLAVKIGDSSVGSNGHIYFDGFSDFTAQEMRIIEQLIKKGADITISITCDLDTDDTDTGNMDIFVTPRRTISQLRAITSDIEYIRTDYTQKAIVAPQLRHIEKHLFRNEPEKYTQKSTENTDVTPVTIYAAPSKYTECEYAAATIWKLIYTGYRWRDIAVMARDFSQYESVCGHVFEKYDIPYFTGGRADIQNKPPIALIDAALSIIVSGWEYASVGRYIKTGILNLNVDDTALLENYVIMWNIRGAMWQNEWKMPPSGYPAGYTSDKQKKKDEQMLIKLNQVRNKIVTPLMKLQKALNAKSTDKQTVIYETTAKEKLQALYEFLTDISLPDNLAEKAEEFNKRGELRQADEYRQLHGIIINALDMMYTILGETKLTTPEFKKMAMLVLTQYSVGVIPTALDTVVAGSMTMSRRRDIKCLIILGASDENLPKLSQSTGILSDNERKELSEKFTYITSGMEERLYREMNMLYQTLTLPSEKLVMIFDKSSGSGPSYLINHLCNIFDISEETLVPEQYLGICKATYSELAEYSVIDDNNPGRQALSKQAASMLYGNDIVLSATQVDGYYSCPYKYFLQKGLKLNPRKKAEFDAMSAGSFMHTVLEGVFKELTNNKSLSDADETLLRKLAGKYAEEFVSRVLMDFEGKDKRFEYLFRCYEKSILYVLNDMVDEFKSSEFTPREFEMNLSELSDKLRGYVDRVDVFEMQDRLYIRVVDYKTRKSAYEFNLTDVYNGRDMQMLIYLFALVQYGIEKFGKTPRPAGVLYMPARDIVINTERNATDEEINKQREKKMIRSGIILNDPLIIDAMESGKVKKYIQVKTTKEGTYEGKSLITDYQLELLSEHIKLKMENAKKEILSGVNICQPYYKKINDNACLYCEYYPVCRFDENQGDKRRYAGKISHEEIWDKLRNKE